MAQTQPWYRFYTETPDDLKLKRAALEIGCERIYVLGIWTAMMTLAKRSPIPGALYIAKNAPASPAEIADLAGTANLTLVQQAISTFHSLDMIEFDGAGAIWLVHWEERQFESDSSTSRVRRFREKQKPPPPPPGNDAPPEDRNVSETLQRNVSETDQSRVEQIKRQSQKQSQRESQDALAPEQGDQGYKKTFEGKPGLAMYYEITGQYPPVTDWERIESNFTQGQARRSLPREEFKKYVTSIFQTWCATRTTEGKPYNPSNPGWTDWLPNGFGSAGPAREANAGGLSPDDLAAAGQAELEKLLQRRAKPTGGTNGK